MNVGHIHWQNILDQKLLSWREIYDRVNNDGWEYSFLIIFHSSYISLILAIELHLKMHCQGLKAATSILVLHKKIVPSSSMLPTTHDIYNLLLDSFFPFFLTQELAVPILQVIENWLAVGHQFPQFPTCWSAFTIFHFSKVTLEFNAEKTWISNIVSNTVKF